MRKSVELYLLCFWMALLSMNGLGGGVAFIIKPDGTLLGMTTEWLVKTPFPDFLIPGILLLILNGIFPLIALAGLISRRESRFFNTFNIMPDKHWGWTFSVYSGIITIAWVIVQQLITSYSVLQPIITAVGLIILVLSLMPRIQKRSTNNISEYPF